MIYNNGIPCLKNYEWKKSYLRSFVFDLDVKGAYPNEEICFNIGREQTLREMCGMSGIKSGTARRASINLTMPRMNAYEIAQDILDAPSFETLLKSYEASKKKIIEGTAA